jgi:cell division protein FtsB
MPKARNRSIGFSSFKKNAQNSLRRVPRFVLLIVCLLAGVAIALLSYFSYQKFTQVNSLQTQVVDLQTELNQVKEKLAKTEAEYEALQNEDQKVRNDELEENLNKLKETYGQAVAQYERILDLRDDSEDVTAQEALLAEVLTFLSKDQYQEATEKLGELQNSIAQLQAALAAKAQLNIPNAPPSNDAPGSGYARQSVTTDIGSYTVSLVAGDLSSTQVIVDTASGSDCGNDCPVLPLSDYVSRNGGYAGVNGTYFCPASYPSCAGKTNTYDLLVMNKDKTYFNSDNNVYSNNPAVIFFDGSIRFVGAASGWGRDTSPTGVLSNYPLLLSGGEIRFAGDGDPKKGSKGNRSFVANKGNTVYIGVVHGATVAESAWALKGLGMENALNLDSGGSTALWSAGYKVGPGRNIPNAIIFVRK